jgi:hypothetical protein
MSRFFIIFACLLLTTHAFAEEDDFSDIENEVIEAGTQLHNADEEIPNVKSEAAIKLAEQEANAVKCRDAALKKSANSLPVSDEDVPSNALDSDLAVNMTTPMVSTQDSDSVTYLTYGAVAKSSFTVLMTLKTADCSFVGSHVSPN